MLIIDPSTNTIDTSSIANLGNNHSAWHGGVLAPNGLIYGIPSSATAVLVLDPAANATTLISGLPVGIRKWSGGVLTGNGRVYGIPYQSTSVLVIKRDCERL